VSSHLPLKPRHSAPRLIQRYRWQGEEQRDILVHQSLPPLDRAALAASTMGMMHQVHILDHVRLVALADEVNE